MAKEISNQLFYANYEKGVLYWTAMGYISH